MQTRPTNEVNFKTEGGEIQFLCDDERNEAVAFFESNFPINRLNGYKKQIETHLKQHLKINKSAQDFFVIIDKINKKINITLDTGTCMLSTILSQQISSSEADTRRKIKWNEVDAVEMGTAVWVYPTKTNPDLVKIKNSINSKIISKSVTTTLSLAKVFRVYNDITEKCMKISNQDAKDTVSVRKKLKDQFDIEFRYIPPKIQTQLISTTIETTPSKTPQNSNEDFVMQNSTPYFLPPTPMPTALLSDVGFTDTFTESDYNQMMHDFNVDESPFDFDNILDTAPTVETEISNPQINFNERLMPSLPSKSGQFAKPNQPAPTLQGEEKSKRYKSEGKEYK